MAELKKPTFSHIDPKYLLPAEPEETSTEETPVAEERKAGEPNFSLLTSKLKARGEKAISLIQSDDYDHVKERESLTYQPSVQDDNDDAITYPGTMDAPVRNITNFLFGQDMAIWGLKWDEEGFDWSMQQLTDQWTKEPLWSNLLTAGLQVASIGFPLMKATKFSSLLKVGRFKYYDAAGLLGHNGEFVKWQSVIKTPEQEMDVLKLLGYIDKDATKISSSALSTSRRKAMKDSMGAYRWQRMAQVRRYEAEEAAARKMVQDMGVPKEAQQLQVDQLMMQRGLTKPNVSAFERAQHEFDKRFGQQLWKISNDPSPHGQLRMQLRENLQNFYGKEAFGDFDSYKSIVNDGSKFARTFHQRMLKEMDSALDVGKIGSLKPEEEKVFSLMKNMFLNHQKQWVDSGLAPNGAPAAHIIALTKGGVPQGYVPNLVEASDMFKALYSPTMLHKKKYASKTEELQEIWKRVDSGEIQVNTLNRLLQGYINDRMLLHNFTTVSEVLTNTKHAQFYNDLARVYKDPKYFPKDLISMDAFFREKKFPEGATALRNMLEKKIRDGVIPQEVLGPNGELPYLNSWAHKAIFDEDGMWDQSEASAITLLEVLTSMHKTAKCFVGGTRVSTSKGYIKIEDLTEFKEGFHYPDFDFTVTTPTGRVVPLASYKEKSTTIKLTFRDGSVFEGTPEHPIMTDQGVVKLKDLEENTIVEDFFEGAFSKEYYKVQWNIWKKEPDLNSTVEITLDEDIAELIGWVMGDGSIYDGMIRISIGAEDYAWSTARLTELCDRIGLKSSHTLRTRKNRNALGTFSIHNATFVHLLQHLGVNKKDLKIPEFIFRSPKSVVIAILRGLLVTDGSVSQRDGAVGFTTKSEQLARDVQLLLKWLGIANSISLRKSARIKCIDREYYNKEYWVLRYNSTKAKETTLGLDLINMPRKKDKIKIETKETRSWKNRVKNIEVKEEIKDVYDLSLPAPHLFVTDGIISHNTAFNPGSHTQNVLGNTVMLAQAGFNVFRPHNAKLLKDAKDMFEVIHDGQVAALKEFGTNAPNKDDVVIFVRRYLATHGKHLKYKGTKIDASELADPLVQQLYMEGSFDSAEGYGFLKRHLDNKQVKGVTKKVIQGALSVTDNPLTRYTFGGKKLADGTIEGGYSIGGIFEGASKWYMGEDVIPKLALYAKMRAEGMSMNAAVREVAERMPMYGLTGSWIKEGRKWAFPWISFPSEALRITKNNLYDHPLRMLPWFKAAGIAQSFFSSLGQGPATEEDRQLTERTLPMWAQTRDTVTMEGKQSQTTGAAVQSGLVGTAVGGAFGGIPGAIAGGILGAAGAGALTYFSDDEQAENEIRGAVLNWLPHSSFLPKIDSPDYHYWNFEDALNQMPAEPLAIFRGILQIVEGRDAFGNPITASGFSDKIGKGVAQMVGFVAPPWIQKYGFQVTTPDITLSEQVLGKSVPGDITNIRRFLVDSGQSVDAITGRPGGLVLDLLLNNLGLWKSYRGFGQTQITNSRVAEDRIFTEIRAYHSRQLRFHVLNGNDPNINDIMRRVFNTFSEQYRDNPSMAGQQFGKWATTQLKTIGEYPAFRGLNEQELKGLMELNISKTGEIRSLALKKIIESIKTERALRGLQQ